jgi:hypothetical protein
MEPPSDNSQISDRIRRMALFERKFRLTACAKTGG